VGGAPDGAGRVESAGVEVKPEVRFGLPGEQTSFNVGYAFSAKFYDKDFGGRADNTDYTHVFDMDFAHVFSPRFDMSVDESFVIGQEPDILQDPAGVQRIDGDNMRNFAGINFNAAATQLLSFGFGYQNAFYNYDDEIPTAPGGVPALNPGDFVLQPSNSGLLDRSEHKVRVDSNWTLTPATTGVLGYFYSQNIYTGDEVIRGFIGVPGSQVLSDYRNSEGHTFYVGAQHLFTPTLSGYANVGAQYFSYYNDPASESQWSPYAQGGLTYALQTTTTTDIGFRYERAASNEAGGAGQNFVRDTEQATLYGNLKHRIFSKLIGTLNGSINDSKYNGGGPLVDNQHQLYFRVGVDLAYEFTRNFSGHIGYNYDKLESDLPGRDYDRNRVYLGLTAGF